MWSGKVRAMAATEDAGNIPASDSSEELRWMILNGSALPVWLAMIVAPRSRATASIVRASNVWLAGYSLTYVTGLVVAGRETGPPTLTSASVRDGLRNPKMFHTAWVHYLAFDMFVGRWIWRRAIEEGRSPRLALLLTLMLGPAGLGVFGLQRRSLSLEHKPA